jgi:pimeloyl-ACP methyl ester carboxylesterase
VEWERLQLGPLPALASGDGPPLLYLGGLLHVAGVDASLVRRTAEVSARPLVGVRRVVYTNRRFGLPSGMTMADFAAEHAQAIDALGAGAVDVLGVSTGGSIAQQLAADHPDAVRRLVLVSTGCRLSPTTRRLQADVAAQIRAGNASRALAAVALSLFIPGGAALSRFVAPFGRTTSDLSDLATTIEAEDDFDLARCRATIHTPTLIAAGERDRFYPRELLEETQHLISGSRLLLVPRRGHLTALGASQFRVTVREFLT